MITIQTVRPSIVANGTFVSYKVIVDDTVIYQTTVPSSDVPAQAKAHDNALNVACIAGCTLRAIGMANAIAEETIIL